MPLIAPRSALVLLMTHGLVALLLALVSYLLYVGRFKFWFTDSAALSYTGVGLTLLHLVWEVWLFGLLLRQRHWVWAGWVVLLLFVDSGVLLGFFGVSLLTFGGLGGVPL